MKKGVPFKWDQACSNAFESIKSYLMKPPVLAAPILGKPRILYISAQERSVGALLAQENNKGKENSLYYLSRMMTPNELNYSPIEKLGYKGKALAYFLADHPILDDWELTNELPDKDAMVIEVQPPWKIYFDGAAHRGRIGTGVVFVTSQGEVLPYSFTLMQLCSNNVVEYQALILGLEMDVELKRLQLQVFGDSKLVVNQLLGSYEVKKPELRPYHDYAKKLMGWLGDVTIQHVRRKENKKADDLAALASSLILLDQAQVTACQKWVVPPPNESSGGHLYILVATDYFSKWAETVTLKEVKKENVASFIRVNIIYRFGIPRYIITDNVEPFDNRLMNNFCELFGFKQHNSSTYNAVANGLAEAFNKTLCNLLKKVVSKFKRDWTDCMEKALWAYRTTHRTPPQATPYSLIYGVEAVLLERQIPSLRLAIQVGITDEENARL
ncbi:uncharacterized protein [Nicotiana sylvestris]|uniref:uncharacterized protein n=1 Tax=Nicotiana sylvestris TaxID=4096 RepID=UPI00388CC042